MQYTAGRIYRLYHSTAEMKRSSSASALHPSEPVFPETGTLNLNALVRSAVPVVQQGYTAPASMSCMNSGCLTLLFLPEDGELAANKIFSFSLEI